MITGLVLMKLAPGDETQALETIKKIKGVKGATATFGPWDAVATVEVEDLTILAKIIVGTIRAVRGVSNTETLIEVKI